MKTLVRESLNEEMNEYVKDIKVRVPKEEWEYLKQLYEISETEIQYLFKKYIYEKALYHDKDELSEFGKFITFEGGRNLPYNNVYKKQ